MEKKKQGAPKEREDVGQENQTGSWGDESETGRAKRDGSAPGVVTLPEQVTKPTVTEAPRSENLPPEEQVHVEPHLPDLITGITVPLEEEERAREQSNLDHTIHMLLIVGLTISVAFILFGLFLDLILHRVVPTTIPDLGEVFSRVIFLRPSGFLALGLLVLIATPVLRVVGSIMAFIYERDWRYAGITFLVLLVVMLSIIIGKG